MWYHFSKNNKLNRSKRMWLNVDSRMKYWLWRIQSPRRSGEITHRIRQIYKNINNSIPCVLNFTYFSFQISNVSFSNVSSNIRISRVTSRSHHHSFFCHKNSSLTNKLPLQTTTHCAVQVLGHKLDQTSACYKTFRQTKPQPKGPGGDPMRNNERDERNVNSFVI